jgi:hypothetical protein
MRKSNLLGGALLLAALFVNTSCKEIFGNMDLSGDTTVSSYVAINTATKTAAPAEEFTLSITKIGDGTVTWSSSDPAIAEVQGAGLSAKVIAKKSGNATITANVAAAGNYQAGSAKCAVAVRVQTYDQLKDEIANASKAEKTTIYLDGTKTIEVTANLDMYEKEIAIEGNGAIISTASSFLISKSFTLQDVKVDITGGTKQFIQIDPNKAGKKNQDVYTDAAVKDFFLIDEITLNKVWIKNLHNSLIDPMKLGPLALTTLNIENCIIQLDYNTSKTFIDFSRVKPDDAPAGYPDNRGAIKNVNIKNNTIYNLQAASAYFIRFAHNGNAAGAFGTKNGTSTFDHQFLNNTIYNVFPNQNFGNNTVNNKVSAITMKDNIFGQIKNINKYVQNNQAPVITMSGNFIFGSATQSNDYTEKSKKDGDVTYKWTIATKLDDAPFTVPTAALDLTKANGGLNLTPSGDAAAAGDPRWIKK